MNQFLCKLCITLGILFFRNGWVSSQNSDAPKPLSQTFLLTNCHVVKQPGTVLKFQNVLIRDGIIVEIGSSIKGPFDAQIIKSDSMYVYAGFIDGHSYTGIPKPESKDRPNVTNPGNPPLDIAGVTPQRHVGESFKSSDKSVTDMRAAGFVMSNVAPRGLMLSGSSTIFLLGDESFDKMILISETSQNLAFEPARGVFPATIIGVIAKFRELYKNALIASEHKIKYAANPSGLIRPDYSLEVSSLANMSTKKQKLQITAPYTKDVHRSISLSEELGFELILTNVKQGWHYIDKIKSKNYPLFLSLELPEVEKEKKDTTSVKKDSLSIIPKKDTDPFDKKRLQSIKEYEAQASLFEKKNIPFGFSMLNVKPSDLKKTLSRMIKAGLSADYALAALTTFPAQILGISGIAGTVEKGKMANIILTDKPYFEEKSNIKMIFIDGKKYDFSTIEKKPEIQKSDPKMTNDKYDGVWSYEIKMNDVSEQGTLNIFTANEKYNAYLIDNSNPSEENRAQDIKVNGHSMSFFTLIDIGKPMQINFEIIFDGPSYKGTVMIPEKGSFQISGNRSSVPK